MQMVLIDVACMCMWNTAKFVVCGAVTILYTIACHYILNIGYGRILTQVTFNPHNFVLLKNSFRYFSKLIAFSAISIQTLKLTLWVHWVCPSVYKLILLIHLYQEFVKRLIVKSVVNCHIFYRALFISGHYKTYHGNSFCHEPKMLP